MKTDRHLTVAYDRQLAIFALAANPADPSLASRFWMALGGRITLALFGCPLLKNCLDSLLHAAMVAR